MNPHLPEGAANHPCAPYNLKDADVWYELSDGKGAYLATLRDKAAAIEEAHVSLFRRRNLSGRQECVVKQFTDYGAGDSHEECVAHLEWDADTNSVQNA
ncbi:hypothetical protein V5G24_10005 [Xanthobacter sp. VTT E-85241]|uniref:hypothetical protein n=1 Tax=Roseixanthobacter finlandensis TaxID=3119922 RepID=UPI003729DFB8